MKLYRFFSGLSNVNKKVLSLTREDLDKILIEYNSSIAKTEELEQNVKFEQFDKKDDNLKNIPVIHSRRQRLWARLNKKIKDKESANYPAAYDLMIDGVFDYPIESKLFSEHTEAKTLVQDVVKAREFAKFQQMLYLTGIPERLLSDSFEVILRRAYSRYLSKASVPYLVNEECEFEAPYASRRSTMENLLRNTCTRSALDEATIQWYLDNSIKSQKQISQLPPEVLEPLIAFRGVTNWSHCALTRLDQKVAELDKLVKTIVEKGTENSAWNEESIDGVLETLKENTPDYTDEHPFRNRQGFESKVPKDVVGSIRAGRPVEPSLVR